MSPSTTARDHTELAGMWTECGRLEKETGRVGALVGVMLELGYTIGAMSPLVLGAVRDLTGSFTASLWLLIGFSGLLLGSVVALPARSELRASH